MKRLLQGFIVVIIVVIIAGLLLAFKKPSSNITDKKIQTPASLPKAGSCLVLDEANCNKATIEEWQYQNDTYLIAGFHLDPGTTIFSPIKGQESANKAGTPFNGSIAIVKSDNPSDNTIYTFVGQFGINKSQAKAVEQGTKIASIQGERIDNINGYNLILIVTKEKASGVGFESNDQLLKQMFSKKAQ